MKQRSTLLSAAIVLSVSAVMTSAATASAINPLAASRLHESPSPFRHQLPILNVTPAEGTADVSADAPIRITLDKNAPSFQRFKRQLLKGNYIVALNDRTVQTAFDASANQITVAHGPLEPAAAYTVTVKWKAEASKAYPHSTNASYSYSFSFTTKAASGLHYTIIDPSTLSPDILDRGNIFPDEPYEIIVARVSKLGDGSETSSNEPWIEWAGPNLGFITLLDEENEILVKIYVPAS